MALSTTLGTLLECQTQRIDLRPEPLVQADRDRIALRHTEFPKARIPMDPANGAVRDGNTIEQQGMRNVGLEDECAVRQRYLAMNGLPTEEVFVQSDEPCI